METTGSLLMEQSDSYVKLNFLQFMKVAEESSNITSTRQSDDAKRASTLPSVIQQVVRGFAMCMSPDCIQFVHSEVYIN